MLGTTCSCSTATRGSTRSAPRRRSGRITNCRPGRPNLPADIRDFDTLSRIVRLLLWIAGPRHACVNFPQIEYTAFVPNQPTAIYLLPDASSDNFILDMMPPV